MEARAVAKESFGCGLKPFVYASGRFALRKARCNVLCTSRCEI